MVAVSFSGGGNRSARRKPLICCKSLTKLYHIMLYRYTSPWTGFKLTTLVVIGSDCTGSCKSNYHMITITTTAAPITPLVPSNFCNNHTTLFIQVWHKNHYNFIYISILIYQGLIEFGISVFKITFNTISFISWRSFLLP